VKHSYTELDTECAVSYRVSMVQHKDWTEEGVWTALPTNARRGYKENEMRGKKENGIRWRINSKVAKT